MASDDFSRPDANPLDGNWTTVSGFNPLKLVSGQVEVDTLNSNSIAASTVSTATESRVTIADVTGRNGGPAIHIEASGGYCLLNYDSGNFYIFTMLSFTTIGFNSGLTYQVGDVIGLRDGPGDVKIGSQNGVDVVTSSADTTYTAGAPGIFIYNELKVNYWTDGAAPPDPGQPEAYYDGEAQAWETPEELSCFEFYQDDGVVNRDNVVAPYIVQPELPASFEWEDPNERDIALWLWPEPQAPPDDIFDQLGNVFDGYFGEDDELEGFSFSLPETPVAADQPLAFDFEVPVDEPAIEGFDQQPLSSDDLPQQGIYEDGQHRDPEDEPFGFSFDQAVPDVEPASVVVEDASTQPFAPEDEDFAFADAPLADENLTVTPYEDSSDQLPSPEGDEDFGFFQAAAPADVFDLNIVWQEDSADQQDTPDDEAFGFDNGPLPDNFVPPPPPDGRAGPIRQWLVDFYERAWKKRKKTEPEAELPKKADEGKPTPSVEPLPPPRAAVKDVDAAVERLRADLVALERVEQERRAELFAAEQRVAQLEPTAEEREKLERVKRRNKTNAAIDALKDQLWDFFD